MTWSRKLEQPASSKLDDFEMNFAGTKIPAEFLAVSGSARLRSAAKRCVFPVFGLTGKVRCTSKVSRLTQFGSAANHYSITSLARVTTVGSGTAASVQTQC